MVTLLEWFLYLVECIRLFQINLGEIVKEGIGTFCRKINDISISLFTGRAKVVEIVGSVRMEMKGVRRIFILSPLPLKRISFVKFSQIP